MGSGETSPTMVTAHQKILQSVANSPNSAVVSDTPFGFQENADDLTAKILDYFSTSVGREIAVVSYRSVTESADKNARAVSALREAEWLFAGPGSPTYALRTWQDSGLAEHVSAVLNRGAAIFASAAALTLGSHTVPVYEIYKVGEQPHWLTGLNILEQHTGFKAAVIPHFDNAEGGNHDTRYCYLGENRLRALEAQLPADVFIIGVDEHTAISFDLDEKVASVFGRGTLTLRKGTSVTTYPSGTRVAFDDIARAVAVERKSIKIEQNSDADILQARESLANGAIDLAVTQILQADRMDRDTSLRTEVHSLIVKLGELAATPKIDLHALLAPSVELLLELRKQARVDGRWDQADLIRDALVSQGISLKDSPETTIWELTD